MLTVVIPTCDEAGNIKPLLTEIKQALGSTDYEIIFIDDSDDGTAWVIAEEAAGVENFRIVHREGDARTGLATAVLHGFELARGDYVCCIDADLQHPPQTIPALLQALIENDADLAIASRYIQGGSADGLRTTYRRLVSLGCKYLVYTLFPSTRSTTDPCSGFFVFRRKLLDGGPYRLEPRGYKILLELLVLLRPAKVCEVPYALGSRHAEMSKANLKEGVAFLRHLTSLWARS
jgi:dolichol-phosphate mannosyltransferase